MILVYFENDQWKKLYKVSYCFVMSGYNCLCGKIFFIFVIFIFYVYVKVVIGVISYGGGVVCQLNN